MTEKCQREIENLKEAIEEIKIRDLPGLQKRRDSEGDLKMRQVWRREIDKRWTAICKKEDKIRGLEQIGFSTSEQTMIKKESPFFTSIHSDRSLGSRDLTKIGFSKVTGAFVEVELTRWSGFMSNVKGCGSLANKTDLNSVKILTDAEYEQKKGGDKIHEVSFIGNQKTVVHPDGTKEVFNN